MNREIDELKDQYYDIKDISESELEVIEADIRSMEDRLEVRIRDILNSLIAKSSVSSVHNHENAISQANSKLKLEIKLPEIPLPMILWKDSPVQTQHCNLRDFLCTRTIQQLVRDEGDHYPLAAAVTIRDIYMDILTAKEWNDFMSTLPVIQNIHVPRLVIGKGRIIIHGFADASTAAYAAVLYAQSISEEDVSTRLVQQIPCVAPVKPITIPRLKCTCVLLSQLLEKVLHSLTLPIQQIMLWTDSNIVLAWIQRSPQQLKTFIGNRIKIIQRLTKEELEE
ncbi:uncharacterized protein TNIN_235381 [Trichonephila inaurata madagascariensis]|uniref:Uncharacterized protein n=1 Tax=Trichonephila inaurata madagascariensis TaxID=2747483 RepID=A0A8X6IL41_9ARAC|nr:uncharacterized protein TNIN_235381 [Trichonephila inaurata madagascariensis]